MHRIETRPFAHTHLLVAPVALGWQLWYGNRMKMIAAVMCIGAALAGCGHRQDHAANAPERKGEIPPSKRVVPVFEGVVDETSGKRLFDVIASHQDEIVGLKLSIDKESAPDGKYMAESEAERVVVSYGDPLDAPSELVISGDMAPSLTAYNVDGFYPIKFSGMAAAGAMSWWAKPVDEAAMRLNPQISLVPRKL